MNDSDQAYSQVVLLTATHSISGQLEVGERRLSDFLNALQGSVVVLENATIAELSHPGKPVARQLYVAVRRPSIVIIFESVPRVIPPTLRLYTYKPKQAHMVLLALSGMEIRGKIHTTGALDVRNMVSSPGERFLAVTDARVTLGAVDRGLIEQEAIMVNTDHIESVAEIPEEPREKLQSA
ncbi:MAG: hypothetical protein M1570_07340 [Chloroflexi bacterium]|nr:hypothetical protein [Chloroflexota bacterium]